MLESFRRKGRKERGKEAETAGRRKDRQTIWGVFLVKMNLCVYLPNA